jgi:hypothetical protein
MQVAGITYEGESARPQARLANGTQTDQINVRYRVLDHFKRPYAEHLSWARELRSPADTEAPVALATEFAADALGQTKTEESVEEAIKLYQDLGKQIDPMREGYWNFKIREAQMQIAL